MAINEANDLTSENEGSNKGEASELDGAQER